mmetsp:Transcript_16058/g.21219  ORF Transcript_16058/g.21219 Transcript_16058/m.21219 type:complete len:680 (+) Transcript_16058:88-2127(+)
MFQILLDIFIVILICNIFHTSVRSFGLNPTSSNRYFNYYIQSNLRCDPKNNQVVLNAKQKQWKLYDPSEVTEDDEDDDGDYDSVVQELFEGTWDGWLSSDRKDELDFLDNGQIRRQRGEELVPDLEASAIIDRFRRAAQDAWKEMDVEEDEYDEPPKKTKDPYWEGYSAKAREDSIDSDTAGFETDSQGQTLYDEIDGDGYTYYCYSVDVNDTIKRIELQEKEFQEGTNNYRGIVASGVPDDLKSKIRVGDCLLSINGKPVLTKRKEKVMQLLSEASQPVTLTMKHELYKTLTFREGRIGLVLSEGDGILNKLVISDFRDRDKDRIPDHNLAQHVELMKGDSIVAIQGISVADLSFDQAIAILKDSKRPLDVTVFTKPFRYPLPDSKFKANLQNPAPIFTERPFTRGKQQKSGYEPGWRGPSVRNVDLLIENGGSLTASWFPSLPYNPGAEDQRLLVAGGRGKLRPSRWMDSSKVDVNYRSKNDDYSFLDVLFKGEDLLVPPIPIYFLPKFIVRLDVQPNEIRGTINLKTGEIELTFDSEFEIVAFEQFRSEKVKIACTLTTEATDGGFIKVANAVGSGVYVPRSEGSRLDYFGRARLVGRALLEETDDPLTNILFFLPTIGLAEVRMRFFLPDKGGIPLQKEVPNVNYDFDKKVKILKEEVNDNDTAEPNKKKWWVDQ